MSTPTGYRVQDPSADQVVETFPALADGEVDHVLAAAETAQRAWAARPIEERATIVQKVADLFEERKDELAQIIATEMGKRVTEGVEEATNAAKACRAEQAADPEAFTENYGSNHNQRNAFGKCVSKKVHADQAES